MDHHCPWTANCVGHGNMPHFIRFLLWVDYTTGYTLVHLFKRAATYWNDRNLPAYLIDKTPLAATIILIPLSLFVLTTVGILTLRVFYHIMFSGMSQIETWEYERLESQIHTERTRDKIRQNYETIFGKELENVSSWSFSRGSASEDSQSSGSPNFTIDDIVFPYDLNPWKNLIQAFGYPWNWLLPWGGLLGNGLEFPRSEYASIQDQDLGSLPWPPDSGHQDRLSRGDQTDIVQDNETVVTRSSGVYHRNDLNRTEWYNDFGEKLSDFGVDLDAEK
ncbi:Palmitoyltransferase PFA4 [Wickerhamomyces ciferrii]|uniref:Palmitoyltransferase n=1 Tax=Wickerhamomyces ciferrii (strain ATCC 14091 / BCRC 22168 / CBS 111 / JCM 3599 / NBRC 0793 / NRRL Y-1031 F-60-10) TaxID=1206466 RepID=K0KID4_WICCF|nr:Palmitoyltransferase PFA4 [Wickerhamomyces ciferrii]CCH41932.1 Palmitoyltransferase PFA4 [Wickerhamomyces ciferrii]